MYHDRRAGGGLGAADLLLAPGIVVLGSPIIPPKAGDSTRVLREIVDFWGRRFGEAEDSAIME